MSIADTDENQKSGDPLVYTPVRVRQSMMNRLKSQMEARGYETLSPVMRQAIDKGLEEMERETDGRKDRD